MRTIGADDPLAVAAIEAIHAGDVEALRQLLAEHPEPATARFGSEECQDEPGANGAPRSRRWRGRSQGPSAITQLR
jgi:hypothetical protein